MIRKAPRTALCFIVLAASIGACSGLQREASAADVNGAAANASAQAPGPGGRVAGGGTDRSGMTTGANTARH